LVDLVIRKSIAGEIVEAVKQGIQMGRGKGLTRWTENNRSD
jgi:hypothetical protein